MSENNQSEKGPSVETSNRGVPGRSPSKSRRVSLGDTSPRVTPGGIEAFEIKESVAAAQEAQAAAVRDIVASAPVHDIHAIANSLRGVAGRASPACSGRSSSFPSRPCVPRYHRESAPPPASSLVLPAEKMPAVFRPTGWRRRCYGGRGRVRADRKPGQARRMTVFEKHATLVVEAAQVALAFSLLVRGTAHHEVVPMPIDTPDTVVQVYQVVPVSRSVGSELLGPALQQHVAPGCQSSDRCDDH
jgi:hypothetical protein